MAVGLPANTLPAITKNLSEAILLRYKLKRGTGGWQLGMRQPCTLTTQKANCIIQLSSAEVVQPELFHESFYIKLDSVDSSLHFRITTQTNLSNVVYVFSFRNKFSY